MYPTSVIFLAGGQGTRIKSDIPKQFLPLNGKPIALHSFDLFANHPMIEEIIVISDPSYQPLFKSTKVVFAPPGKRRQDSVYNGFIASKQTAQFYCIHDAARPFITFIDLENVMKAAAEMGAATVATPTISTIKEVDENNLVVRTLDRNRLWEIGTPQVIRSDLLKKGFEIANGQNFTVTDDVSLVELMGHKVKIVQGSYGNYKITTPEDLSRAKVQINHCV